MQTCCWKKVWLTNIVAKQTILGLLAPLVGRDGGLKGQLLYSE